MQHAKIISRRLLVTVSEGLTLVDRKRDNVPANKRGWCRVYTPDLKVAMMAPQTGSASVLGHTSGPTTTSVPCSSWAAEAADPRELQQHYYIVVVVEDLEQGFA